MSSCETRCITLVTQNISVRTVSGMSVSGMWPFCLRSYTVIPLDLQHALVNAKFCRPLHDRKVTKSTVQILTNCKSRQENFDGRTNGQPRHVHIGICVMSKEGWKRQRSHNLKNMTMS